MVQMIRLRAPESKPDGRPAAVPGAAGVPEGRRGVPRRRGLAPSEAMASTERVCPYCGEPPGPGAFCAACGRNLAAVERLPTRAEWEADATAVLAPAAGLSRPAGPALSPAEATGAFLDAMRAAGNPGTTKLPMPDGPQGGPPAPHAAGGGMGRAAGRLGRPRRPEAPSARAPPDDRRDLPPHRQPDPRLGAAQLPGLLRHRGRRRARPAGRRPARRRPRGRTARARRRAAWARSPRGGSATPGR